MSLDYEQAKEIERMIEARTHFMDRISKTESRLSVLETLDDIAKSHEKDIRRLWFWSLGSTFTALIALIIAVIKVFG